jgi:GNAT superfamily N-acetyltransferase
VTGPVGIDLRPAVPADTPRLQEIERLAGRQFADVGMPEIAAHDPEPAEALARYAGDGRSWVALDRDGDAVGYVLVDVVDGNAHVEQISVVPSYQGAGFGRALIDRVAAWAAATGLPALTLTTFRDVPWNAPLYRHLGFHDLDQADIGPELAAVLAHEATLGLDPALRTCMRRPV